MNGKMTMKILMLNYEFPPIGGGAGNAHLALLRQYAQNQDLLVDVLASAPKPGLFTEQLSKNVTIHKVGLHKKHLHFWRRTEVLEWLMKATAHYRRLLRQNSYDVVHAFFGFPTAWLCYRTARMLPYIISLRGSDVPGQHARLKLDYKIIGPLVFKPIWRNASGLVACSRGLKKRALAFMPDAAIDVIPNGVDCERFRPAGDKERIASPQGTVRLLTVGRLSVTKRVDMLIDAVDILTGNGRRVRLTVVGGGSMEDRLRNIVQNRNLATIVEMTGRVKSDDMPEIYRQNDIFVGASMQEGMSNAMLEAMAAGLPIVTTRCEGVDELVADNGIVAQSASPQAIAEAVQLVCNTQTRRQMGLAARERAMQYSWASVAEQYVQLYNRILQKTEHN